MDSVHDPFFSLKTGFNPTPGVLNLVMHTGILIDATSESWKSKFKTNKYSVKMNSASLQIKKAEQQSLTVKIGSK